MATARNRLRDLMENPGSFTGSPGFQFALDQGNQAIARRAAAGGMRGSGNVLAELMKYGTGLAQQDYGNEVDRTLRAAALEQEGELTGRRLDLDAELGRGDLALRGELGRGELALGRDRLGLDRDRLALDRDTRLGELDLGRDRLSLDRDVASWNRDTARRGQDFDLALGSGRLDLDDRLGFARLDADREGRYLDYDLGLGRLDVDRYNARTTRGDARSRDYERRRRLAWDEPRDPYERFY